jgi:hypothetical protein
MLQLALIVTIMEVQAATVWVAGTHKFTVHYNLEKERGTMAMSNSIDRTSRGSDERFSVQSGIFPPGHGQQSLTITTTTSQDLPNSADSNTQPSLPTHLCSNAVSSHG